VWNDSSNDEKEENDMRDVRQKRSKKWAVVLAGAVVFGGLACTSNTTGNLGNLEFYYAADDNLGNFNKPIAAGAKLELFVQDAGDGGDRQVTLINATTDDEAVARVASFSGNSMILEGVADGSFQVDVEATVARTGETEEDAVNMLVRVPEVLILGHTCEAHGNNSAYYLKGNEIGIPFDMKMMDGQDVIGYGYYPVELDNTLATLVEGQKGQALIRYQLGDETGEVVMTSTIDDTTASIKIAAEEEIGGVRLNNTERELVLGQTELVFVHPLIDDEEVCQSNAEIMATSATPDVCDVKPGFPELGTDEDDVPDLLETGSTGWVEIASKTAGDCTFDIFYPNADGGNGVSATFTLPVAE